MRCASCGTDNAPDSRFCGGCGARLAVPGPRVAPTQKIPNDERFPPRQAVPVAAPVTSPVTAPGVGIPRPISATPYVPQHVGAASGAPPRSISAPPGVSAHPISTPPGAPPLRPGSGAPEAFPRNGVAARDARPSRPPVDASSVDDPSLSLPMPARRPWALIFLVLLIDLGLAAAGAWMLYQGLGAGAAGTSADSSPAHPR
jgi:hypothetical protein